MAELMALVTIRAGDSLVQARLEADGVVTVDGTRFEVSSCGGGFWTVRGENATWQVAVAGPPDRPWVAIDGQAAVVEVEQPGIRGRRSRDASGEGMVAPMPATVVKVNVGPGTAVDAGDVVLVLEAMKMELPIRAPRAGLIKAVRCTPGELVQPGVPLVDFE
jgi:biotin carboxyl carrier protein